MNETTYKTVLKLAVEIQEKLELNDIDEKIKENPALEEIYAKYFYMLNCIFSDAFGYIKASNIERFIFDGEGDKEYIYNISKNDYTS